MLKKRNSSSLFRWIQVNWYWGVFAALVLVPVVYSVYRSDNQVYWDGAIGNWFATLLGIVAGVPIALKIERQRMAHEERKQITAHRERAVKVLSLIKDELTYNSHRLTERLNNTSFLPLYTFKSDLWRALSDSGEIQWINNPSVLDKIASTYYYIGIVSTIEEKCYQAIHGINPKYRDGTTASQRLLEDARKIDSELSKSITTAIESIREVENLI